MRGMPTTAASRVREGHVALRDATAVAHLRQAGAVFLGKTNLHEFAFGTTNEDSAFGPARNPHDPTRSPGGSSGGSGASVASGMAMASIGTDTGGSIRIPAAACGIVGLKPSFGEVSADGVVPLSRTLDHVGPLALTRHRRGAPLSRAARTTRRRSRRRRRRSAACGSRCPAPTSAICWTTKCAPGSKRRSSGCATAARGSTRSKFTMPATSRPVYLHLVLGDAAAYHASHAGIDAGEVHAAGPTAAGDGALRHWAKTTCARWRDARCCSAKWMPRWRSTTRSCCRRCRFPRRSSAPATSTRLDGRSRFAT